MHIKGKDQFANHTRWEASCKSCKRTSSGWNVDRHLNIKNTQSLLQSEIYTSEAWLALPPPLESSEGRWVGLPNEETHHCCVQQKNFLLSEQVLDISTSLECKSALPRLKRISSNIGLHCTQSRVFKTCSHWRVVFATKRSFRATDIVYIWTRLISFVVWDRLSYFKCKISSRTCSVHVWDPQSDEWTKVGDQFSHAGSTEHSPECLQSLATKNVG